MLCTGGRGNVQVLAVHKETFRFHFCSLANAECFYFCPYLGRRGVELIFREVSDEGKELVLQ